MKIDPHMFSTQRVFLHRCSDRSLIGSPKRKGRKTYAIGLFLVHLLPVGSPYALISLLFPSNDVHRGSSLMRLTAFSNCQVLLLGEKTSVYKSVKTPPCAINISERYQQTYLSMGVFTVMTTPTITITKLNDCCVARATFSFPLNSDHLYRPSSDMTDICFLVGPEPLPPRLLCVA